MKYMLLFYSNEAAGVPEAEPAGLYADWMNVMKEAKAAGVLLSNNGLAPVSNATTVRVRENKTLTTDGPFAETHEQLGGFFLVDARTWTRPSPGRRRSGRLSTARFRFARVGQRRSGPNRPRPPFP